MSVEGRKESEKEVRGKRNSEFGVSPLLLGDISASVLVSRKRHLRTTNNSVQRSVNLS